MTADDSRDRLATLLEECGRNPWSARQMADFLFARGVTLAAPALAEENARLRALASDAGKWIAALGTEEAGIVAAQIDATLGGMS